MQNVNKLNLIKWKLYTTWILRNRCNHIGNHTIVFDPMRIDNPKSIRLENNIFISNGAWIIGEKTDKETFIVHDNVNIGNFAHIVALNGIEIEESVLIADRVFITDSTHSYEDIKSPIKNQPMRTISNVNIGEGSWIGEGVSILGCSIGKHCVIGAGTIVTRDIPDYCIAVGNPARIIKMYDLNKKEWTSFDDNQIQSVDA